MMCHLSCVLGIRHRLDDQEFIGPGSNHHVLISLLIKSFEIGPFPALNTQNRVKGNQNQHKKTIHYPIRFAGCQSVIPY